MSGNDEILKNNRKGYQDVASCPSKLTRTFFDAELSIYYEEYCKFLRAFSLGESLSEARELVEGRVSELQSLLTSSPSLLDRYQQQLSGTRFSG